MDTKNIAIIFPGVFADNAFGYNSKVQVIKLVRELNFMGLKETKDFVETHGVSHSLEITNTIITENRIAEICTEFRNYGCEVGGSHHFILKELRQLAKDALTIGSDEMAAEIMQLILAEKLRHPNE